MKALGSRHEHGFACRFCLKCNYATAFSPTPLHKLGEIVRRSRRLAMRKAGMLLLYRQRCCSLASDMVQPTSIFG